MDNKTVCAILFGVVVSILHLSYEEQSIPPESQCRYFYPLTIDLSAWLVGAYVMYRGAQLNDAMLALSGSAIVSIHTAHFFAHKVQGRKTKRFGET